MEREKGDGEIRQPQEKGVRSEGGRGGMVRRKNREKER